MPDEPAPLPIWERNTVDQSVSILRRFLRALPAPPAPRRGRHGRGLAGGADRAGPPPGRPQGHQGGHGHGAGRRPLRGRAPGPGAHGPPGIAKVFDGGTTPQGRPYFVMEYVQGRAHHRLLRPAPAEHTRAARAVHAGLRRRCSTPTRRAIIHRDLKPSNMLVTIQDDRPVPKIIDFGVAKATAQPLTERTLFTELGVLIGTPEYMSPEQAEMGGARHRHPHRHLLARRACSTSC